MLHDNQFASDVWKSLKESYLEFAADRAKIKYVGIGFLFCSARDRSAIWSMEVLGTPVRGLFIIEDGRFVRASMRTNLDYEKFYGRKRR